MKLDNEVTYQGKHLYLKKQKSRAKSGIERKIKAFEAKEQRFPGVRPFKICVLFGMKSYT